MIRPAPRARPYRVAARHGLDWRTLSGLAAAGLALLVTIGLVAGGVLSEGRQLDLRTDCPRTGDPAGVSVIALDTTDRLLSAQPRLVDQVVAQVVGNLAPGDRLAVSEIREAGLERDLLFNRCVPGQGSNVERNRLRDAVRVPVRTSLGALATRPEAALSPIVEGVIALVDHPALQPARGRITIYLLTDGLQSSDFADAYASRPFPAPRPNVLDGVTIRLVVLRNERDVALQHRGVEMLVAWLRGSGARVEYEPSTWERFERSP